MLGLKHLTKENTGIFMKLMLAVLTDYQRVSVGQSKQNLSGLLDSKSSKAAAESRIKVTSLAPVAKNVVACDRHGSVRKEPMSARHKQQEKSNTSEEDKQKRVCWRV